MNHAGRAIPSRHEHTNTLNNMKTVFSNTREVCHQWAAQNQLEGKAGNVFFRDSTIYSYGHHFPMARIYTLDTGDRIAVFNPNRYSNSTSKQQSYTRSAWHGNGEAHSVPVSLWPSGNKLTQADLATILAKAAEDIAAAAAAAAEYKRHRAAEKRAAAKLAKLSFPEQLAKWQAGEIHRLPGDYSLPVYLRFIEGGKRIQTSKGAVVPTRAALALWTRYTAAEDITGNDIAGFTVNTADGETVKIGCHLLRVDILRTFFDEARRPTLA